MKSSSQVKRMIQRNLDLRRGRAVLGDRSGNIKTPQSGYVYVRYEVGLDENGNTLYSEPVPVRSPMGVTYPFTPGAAVRIEYDDDDELAIKGADFQGVVGGGYDTTVYNIGNPYINQVAELNILKTYALGTATTPSTKVAITQLIYLNYVGDLKFWSPSASDAVDLSTYAPATAGQKALVLIYLNTLDNTLGTAVSSDKSELLVWSFVNDVSPLINSIPPQAIPVAVWQISNGQTAVTEQDLIYNLRQFINTDNRLVTSTSDPTSGDDVGDGYGLFTWWLNTNTDNLHVCVDNTASSAVWNNTSQLVDRVRFWHEYTDIVSGNALSTTLDANQRFGFYTAQGATNSVGDIFEATCNLEAGSYDLRVFGVTDSNGGICKWTIDGVDVVTGQDWYSASLTNNVVTVDTVSITYRGSHTIRCEVTGQNGSSSDYVIPLTYFELIKQ